MESITTLAKEKAAKALNERKARIETHVERSKAGKRTVQSLRDGKRKLREFVDVTPSSESHGSCSSQRMSEESSCHDKEREDNRRAVVSVSSYSTRGLLSWPPRQNAVTVGSSNSRDWPPTGTSVHSSGTGTSQQEGGEGMATWPPRGNSIRRRYSVQVSSDEEEESEEV